MIIDPRYNVRLQMIFKIQVNYTRTRFYLKINKIFLDIYQLSQIYN